MANFHKTHTGVTVGTVYPYDIFDLIHFWTYSIVCMYVCATYGYKVITLNVPTTRIARTVLPFSETNHMRIPQKSTILLHYHYHYYYYYYIINFVGAPLRNYQSMHGHKKHKNVEENDSGQLHILCTLPIFCVVLCIVCVVLCIVCVVLCIFVLFYVFLCCSMYFLCCYMYLLCCSTYFLCCSMYFLCCSMYFVLFYVFFVLFYVLFLLRRSMYCLYVYVYCTTATGWLPNCS
jgi:hypothetical protein